MSKTKEYERTDGQTFKWKLQIIGWTCVGIQWKEQEPKLIKPTNERGMDNISLCPSFDFFFLRITGLYKQLYSHATTASELK